MITNASSLPIQTSGRPNVQDALSDWFSTLSIGTITKSVVDFQLQEVESFSNYQAVFQPFTTKKLQVKPEGQRTWDWHELHVKGTDLEFCLDDKVIIRGKKCRIMQKFEWREYGYTEYQLIEDYGQAIESSIGENVSLAETSAGVIA